MTVEELPATFGDVDAIVFSAGSNGGSKEVTKAIDGDGVGKAIKAARLAGVERFALVSVLPESWRERDLAEEVASAISNPSLRSAATSVRNFSRLCSAYADGSSASSAMRTAWYLAYHAPAPRSVLVAALPRIETGSGEPGFRSGEIQRASSRTCRR